MAHLRSRAFLTTETRLVGVAVRLARFLVADRFLELHGVMPPATAYSVETDGWEMIVRPTETSYEFETVGAHRDWLNKVISSIIDHGPLPKEPYFKDGSLHIDFGDPVVNAGPTLARGIAFRGRMPLEEFVRCAAAILADPARPWRERLRRCPECRKPFLAKDTNGRWTKYCDDECRKETRRKRARVRRAEQRARAKPSALETVAENLYAS